MKNQSLIISKIQRAKTNHILHLLLTFVTAGAWMFIWILVAISNSLERSRLERLLK